MTFRDYALRYGSDGKAAGAIALELETPTSAEFMAFAPAIQALILYKQLQMVTRLSAIAAGTSQESLQAEWAVREEIEKR